MGTLHGKTVLPDRVLDCAHVSWEGERITEISLCSCGGTSEDLIFPGLVDLHCHGGGGASFPDALSMRDVEIAVTEHLRHGTTRLSATTGAMENERMHFVLSLLARACEKGILEAIEIGGPFLSRERCGAHNPLYVCLPDITLAQSLIQAGGGYVWAMALAPELEGAEELANAIISQGVLPAWGYTNADAATARKMNRQARRAIRENGTTSSDAPIVLHLFNAMREINHRAPGPVFEYLAAAARGEAMVELIGDGVHVSLDLVRTICDIVGPSSLILITDAMAAAGMPDGTYELSGLLVHVTSAVARVRGGNIAGGTSHLLDVVAQVVAAGVPLEDAVAMASTTPSRALGREDIGRICVGARADLVLVDPQFHVRAVYKDGRAVA